MTAKKITAVSRESLNSDGRDHRIIALEAQIAAERAAAVAEAQAQAEQAWRERVAKATQVDTAALRHRLNGLLGEAVQEAQQPGVNPIAAYRAYRADYSAAAGELNDTLQVLATAEHKRIDAVNELIARLNVHLIASAHHTVPGEPGRVADPAQVAESEAETRRLADAITAAGFSPVIGKSLGGNDQAEPIPYPTTAAALPVRGPVLWDQFITAAIG